jgi:4-hydroxy-2-oxoheptanedioate aldolase
LPRLLDEGENVGDTFVGVGGGAKPYLTQVVPVKWWKRRKRAGRDGSSTLQIAYGRGDLAPVKGPPCGHPHVEAHNAERIIKEGYRFLMTAPVRSYPGLEVCRKLTGRT